MDILDKLLVKHYNQFAGYCVDNDRSQLVEAIEYVFKNHLTEEEIHIIDRRYYNGTDKVASFETISIGLPIGKNAVMVREARALWRVEQYLKANGFIKHSLTVK